MSRERVAYHEAGHAAIALAMGARVTGAFIDDDDGAVDYQAVQQIAPNVRLAGPLAEGRYIGAMPPDAHPEAVDAWHTASQTAVCDASASAVGLTHIVAGLLDRHWRLIEMLATELLDCGRLDERDIREIYREYRELP